MYKTNFMIFYENISYVINVDFNLRLIKIDLVKKEIKKRER